MPSKHSGPAQDDDDDDDLPPLVERPPDADPDPPSGHLAPFFAAAAPPASPTVFGAYSQPYLHAHPYAHAHPHPHPQLQPYSYPYTYTYTYPRDDAPSSPTYVPTQTHTPLTPPGLFPPPPPPLYAPFHPHPPAPPRTLLLPPPVPSESESGISSSPASGVELESGPGLDLVADPHALDAPSLDPSSGPTRGNGGTRKPARPPSYIPRPPNAFILFRASFVRTHRAGSTSVSGIRTGAGSSAGAGGLSGKAGAEWRALPDAEREVWERRARAALAEHRRKYPDWRFRPENASGAPAVDWGGGGNTGGGGGKGKVRRSDTNTNAGTATRRRASTTSASVGALGLPEWAVIGLGIEDGSGVEVGDVEKDKGREKDKDKERSKPRTKNKARTKGKEKEHDRSAQAVPLATSPTTTGGVPSPALTPSTPVLVPLAPSATAAMQLVPTPGGPAIQVRNRHQEQEQSHHTDAATTGAAPVADAYTNPGADADQDAETDANARFAVPLTAIGRRSASAPAAPGVGLGGAAAIELPEQHTNAPLSHSPSPGHVVYPLVSRADENATANGSGAGSSTRGGLAREFALDNAFFAGAPGSPPPKRAKEDADAVNVAAAVDARGGTSCEERDDGRRARVEDRDEVQNPPTSPLSPETGKDAETEIDQRTASPEHALAVTLASPFAGTVQHTLALPASPSQYTPPMFAPPHLSSYSSLTDWAGAGSGAEATTLSDGTSTGAVRASGVPLPYPFSFSPSSSLPSPFDIDADMDIDEDGDFDHDVDFDFDFEYGLELDFEFDRAGGEGARGDLESGVVGSDADACAFGVVGAPSPERERGSEHERDRTALGSPYVLPGARMHGGTEVYAFGGYAASASASGSGTGTSLEPEGAFVAKGKGKGKGKGKEKEGKREEDRRVGA